MRDAAMKEEFQNWHSHKWYLARVDRGIASIGEITQRAA
jgi:hypothetical protein